MARMKTGRMMSPKTVDPKTGARIADPEKVGQESQKGSTYSSWPEVRKQYKEGKQDELFKRKSTTPEVRNYLEGKTDILSEDYSEPIVRGGMTQYSYSKPGSFNEEKKPSNDMVSKMPILKAGKATTSSKLAGGKKEKSSEGFFGDYVPSTKGASNKQLKQFASFASKTGLNESFIGKSKAEIGQYKDEMKSQRKSYVKEGNLAGVKATTADIRQSRNAANFVGSKNPLDVPGMVTGYRKEQDNAANRNTIKSQVDRLKKLR
jgi:hypothetical protein